MISSLKIEKPLLDRQSYPLPTVRYHKLSPLFHLLGRFEKSASMTIAGVVEIKGRRATRRRFISTLSFFTRNVLSSTDAKLEVIVTLFAVGS